MSNPADNDIDPGTINNHPQHPYGHALAQHGHFQQQQQHHPQYFSQVPPLHDVSNSHHPQSSFPAIPPSTFNVGIPSYGSIPSSTLVPQVPQEQDHGLAGGAALSHKLTWNSEPGPSSRQQGGLTGATQGLTTDIPSYEPDMRYIKGPLEVLDAEQYDDGRYASKRRLSKSTVHVHATATTAPNPKKRGRKVSQNEQAEPVEETKRARGRPRLETGDQQDMKERRKEQIRLAQRAYRNRKETAITELEAKVAELEASNAEVNATFKNLVMDYVGKNALSAQIPELGRRLHQFQAVLNQRYSEAADNNGDTAASDAKLPVDSSLQSEQSQLESQVTNDGPAHATQQSQQLLGGIIVTHEPESQAISQDLTHPMSSSLEDGSYTLVKMPNPDNASFGFNIGFMDGSVPAQWSLAQWESLPVLASGAFLEKTFSRRLHRRTTEKAAQLLAMDNPPYDTMHRVFGFVRNYATLENIRWRVATVLSRSANEDLNAYGQPFHQIGGSGTHFGGNAKNATFPSGAPFPNAGIGMGPFNEKTTAVGDELLDVLQRSMFPGWQGEWFDSYDVEQFLAQKSINLPRSGDGYIDIPPGEFYDNPLNDQSSTSKSSMRGSSSGRANSDFNISPGGISMNPNQQTMGGNVPYPSPVSSIDSVLPIPAAADMWPSVSMGSDYLAMSQAMSGTMPSLLAYHNPASLGFPDSSHFGYTSPNMDLMGGQARNKRVWFSVEKFIEVLGSKATCLGKGPAFRKQDIVTSFWEAVKPPPE
ncbi:hypothetical protein O1611_g5056 [Lasiodiplodia mahajangana]|uniref:Uncharacterized protein n=1 Tax=Lasiodiplodia mahajangana TaxID=1108764 RepID=A0ACC2JMU2_9PEZI|nr:hypothetical protein O1611_g5056 [Lasiodiplodia mahajangana]